MKIKAKFWLSCICLLQLASQSFNRVIPSHKLTSESQMTHTHQNRRFDSDKIQKSMRSPDPRELRLSKHKNRIDIDFEPIKRKNRVRIKDFGLNPGLSNKKLAKGSRIVRRLQKKARLLHLVEKIQQKIKKRKVKVKQIHLGRRVKKEMKDRYLERHLKSLLRKKNLKRIVRKTDQKLHRALKKAKNRIKRKQKKTSEATRSLGMTSPTSSSSSSSSSGAAGGGQDLSKYNFLPGFAGMPFPPFMMNGPHFHPPLNVTVNSIPNQDSRLEMNPYEIEEANLQSQAKAMEPLDDRMREIMKNIQDISSDVNVKLNEHFDVIQNLNR